MRTDEAGPARDQGPPLPLRSARHAGSLSARRGQTRQRLGDQRVARIEPPGREQRARGRPPGGPRSGTPERAGTRDPTSGSPAGPPARAAESRRPASWRAWTARPADRSTAGRGGGPSAGRSSGADEPRSADEVRRDESQGGASTSATSAMAPSASAVEARGPIGRGTRRRSGHAEQQEDGQPDGRERPRPVHGRVGDEVGAAAERRGRGQAAAARARARRRSAAPRARRRAGRSRRCPPR